MVTPPFLTNLHLLSSWKCKHLPPYHPGAEASILSSSPSSFLLNVLPQPLPHPYSAYQSLGSHYLLHDGMGSSHNQFPCFQFLLTSHSIHHCLIKHSKILLLLFSIQKFSQKYKIFSQKYKQSLEAE